MIDIGAVIEIPCEVKPGPFSDERLISFPTIDGVVSGFVDENDLRRDGSSFFVPGIVTEVETDRLVVRVKGSFFQTNGIAIVPKSIARAA